MSKEIRKELKVIPAQVVVVEHVKNIYACRNCEKENITTPIITAKMPNSVYNRMHGYLLKEPILHADETTMQVLNEEGKKPTSKSYMWLEYRKEKLTPEEIYKKRLEKTKPVLQDFLLWLKTKEKQVLPKSNLGKSINYCLNQWDKLIAFMLDGRIEISNNRAERAIKPFVIGRKNFLFSKSPKGAQASAITYSIIETAKANNLNSFYYLTYLFEKLPNIDLDDMEELDQLLPWSESILENCKIPPNSLYFILYHCSEFCCPI
ncbi:IS66 family transposase [Garciella nitratireducens]|uniref:IS66 family transposase n=1 Tax=Garciella nitratireducens TaxID=218205 RepID=UPI000E00A564|nr:transposase IS66-like protein [Garciella nitratireducens]